jgi:hypothetical protein
MPIQSPNEFLLPSNAIFLIANVLFRRSTVILAACARIGRNAITARTLMNSGLDLGRRYPGEIRRFLELISIQAYVDGALFLRGCGGGMSKEQPWDRATRLYALALKARE